MLINNLYLIIELINIKVYNDTENNYHYHSTGFSIHEFNF
jgi:hypothetical protein